ncbi:MAG: putative polymerase ECF-type sigma factor [Frankiales bacterium]|nr:putative polymerase ECF-type sigma factor [Frankiales bacterium]
MSTAQDLPGLYGEPLAEPVAAPPALRLVPSTPLDFDDAVRRVRPRLHRYAIRRLGDSHEAEELVQEALLRAYTHRDQLLTEEDLSAWSTVVTGRLVIDKLRVRGRSTSVAEVPEGSRVGRDTAEVVVARDEARTALDALDAMPTRQASLLWAREVEGKSYEELCEQFGMTEPAVRSTLTRARKALRREYELRGGTVPVGGLAVLAPWIAGLTWADKLRKCAHKVTAPAVLGAAGIAALGGLVLSPFGSDRGATTFTPAQAIVASAVKATMPTTTASGSVTAARTARSVGARGAGRPAQTTGTSSGLIRATHVVGCNTVSGSNSNGLSVAHRPVGPTTKSTGSGALGAGDSDCIDHTTGIVVGPDLPNKVAAVTGFDNVSVASNRVHCTDLAPLTQITPTLIQCSE